MTPRPRWARPPLLSFVRPGFRRRTGEWPRSPRCSTLPFLFAAAVQAVIRSDLALLARATFGFLPLAMLGIAIAAPLTMLLLAASDQMSGFISSAAGNASAHFLAKAGAVIGALDTAAGSPFLALGRAVVGAAFALWIELLIVRQPCT